ncbi:MAG: di-heme enzyme, partial [Acidobacteria bacterium]
GWTWQLPPGFPVPPVPADNPMSAAKVELGRRLFYDRRLSADGSYACATCHRQELAFTDGRARAVGVTGELHPRSAMSLANVAYNVTLTWADPTLKRLEDQALVPMMSRSPVELGLRGREAEALAGLRAVADYRRRFAAAFPGPRDPFTIANLTRALAAFERTLISGRSPFDRLLYDDRRDALSAAARRGMELFFSPRLGCSRCHGGFNLSAPVAVAGLPPPRPVFHNTGLYNLRDAAGRPGAYPPDNPGLLAHTGKRRDAGRFRAPTLRNVALTAPYMHDGSIATLEEVIDHYAAGGRAVASGPYAGRGRDNPYKSPLVAGFAVTARERRALVAFLHSLTDEAFVRDRRLADPFVSEATVPAAAGAVP